MCRRTYFKTLNSISSRDITAFRTASATNFGSAFCSKSTCDANKAFLASLVIRGTGSSLRNDLNALHNSETSLQLSRCLYSPWSIANLIINLKLIS